jgi:hypothetical protein
MKWTIAVIIGLLLLALLVYSLQTSEGGAPEPTPEPASETGVVAAPGTVGSPAPESGAAPDAAEVAAKSPEAEPGIDCGEGPEGQVPEALLGTGDATLRVWLLSDHTGEPVEAAVRLWRLGVLEGQGWKGGDQIQREFKVTRQGGVVMNLPVGRYRLQCDEQRKGADDSAEFTIESGDNTRHITVSLPRKFPVRFRVFDLGGQEIREGTLETARLGYLSREVREAPEWADPRQPLKGRGFYGMDKHEDGGVSVWDPRPNNLAGFDGFDLGLKEEEWRLKRKYGLHRLRLPGMAELRASVPIDLTRAVTLAGLAVPLTTVLSGVRLPEAEERTLADARVTALAFSEVVESGDPFETAKKTRIHVRVELPGYQLLRYEWEFGESPEPRTLIPEE